MAATMCYCVSLSTGILLLAIYNVIISIYNTFVYASWGGNLIALMITLGLIHAALAMVLIYGVYKRHVLFIKVFFFSILTAIGLIAGSIVVGAGVFNIFMSLFNLVAILTNVYMCCYLIEEIENQQKSAFTPAKSLENAYYPGP